jgi:hypothetical protein
MVTRDITERRAMLNALKESERQSPSAGLGASRITRLHAGPEWNRRHLNSGAENIKG